MKNIRKIVAILAAVLMLCSVVPMSAFAAPGDVALDKNFDDGTNGGFERAVNENGYIVFDATTADWQNTYAYVNGIKSDTLYKVTFKAKANKDAELNFKIQNDWASAHVVETVEVTTEWQDYELTVNSGTVNPAVVLFTSGYYAANAPVYCIDDLKIVETVDPALIGKIVNGDFSDNTGWSLGNGATIADGVLKLENINAWSEAAMQTVPVKANTNYEITWKSQCVSGSGVTYMTLMDAAFANMPITSGQIWMTSTSTEWINHTVTLNTGASEVIIFKLTSEDGATKTINIDDVKITEIKDPSFDGYIYNGDFETGKLGFGTGQVSTLGAWYNLWGSTSHELVAGYNSDYALKGTASGNYNITYQNVPVEANTDYTIVYYSKDSSNSALWVKNAGGNGDIGSQSFNSGSEWAMQAYTFNSGSNTTVWVGLMGISAGATYTVDNIKMFKAAAVSNDGYINNGNFEAGSLTSWQKIWDTQVDAEIVDDGHDSAFGAKVIGKAPWGQLRQKINVEANTDYKVTVWAKDINNMALLIKDGNDSYNISNTGINAGEEWTEITIEFNSGDNTEVYVGVMVNEAGSYGTFDDFKVEKIIPAHVCEHEYFTPCDQYCMICGELTNPEASHNIVHVEAVEPTCTEMGNLEYWYCDVCGQAWLDEACTQNTNLRAVKLPAGHTFDYECSTTCSVCWEENLREASHNLIHHEAKEPTDCANPGNVEYYECEYCGETYTDAEGANPLNPWYINITVDCVRPEGVADCADWTCEICGNENYGYGEHDTGVPACQDGHCSKCDQDVAGYGHQNYDGPACLPGNCYYCGEAMEPVAHENGAWAPCLEGECAYGCGLTYPATADHVDEDANDYCDVCYNHLAHDDTDGDGYCDVCWSEMPSEPDDEIIYGDADGDGEVTLTDAALLGQWLAGYEVTVNEAAADADGDGEITLTDAALLGQWLAGYDVTLGPV